MELGYEKATSQNLPTVKSFMMFEYFKTTSDFNEPEVRNVKASRATRDEYGDNAVGYVQVKRTGNLCHVQAKVTPEHKVRQQPYTVKVIIDESDEKEISSKCHSCAASEAGCKHSICFLTWLHRRSCEESVTSTECYWKKSKLSKIGSSVKSSTLDNIAPKKTPKVQDIGENFLKEVQLEGHSKGSKGALFKRKFDKNLPSKVCIHRWGTEFKELNENGTAGDFLKYLEENLLEKDCKKIPRITCKQAKSPEWYQVRYGRITASKLFEASRCNTEDGSLTASILGGGQHIDTPAMKRGRMLEDKILAEVSKMKKMKINKCGLFINKEHPIFGASPDGITDTHVIEVKCPFAERTIRNYIGEDQTPKPKLKAQIQLQMFLTGRKLGYICIARPDFETSKEFEMCQVRFDEVYVKNLMSAATTFWEKSIFPRL